MTREKFCGQPDGCRRIWSRSWLTTAWLSTARRVGEAFDPHRNTVVGDALPTDEPALAGTDAACLAPGFEREGKLLVEVRVSACARRTENEAV